MRRAAPITLSPMPASGIDYRLTGGSHPTVATIILQSQTRT
jgi:hypothetical protein